MAQATIRDVAREAGVSVASVSRVLNDQGVVSAKVRARVLSAAAALRYSPHAGARSLSRARSDMIGVVLPDLHGEFFSETLRGMDREASARGLHLLLSNMHGGPDDAVAALHTMRGRVDGLIVMAPGSAPEHLDAHLPRALPTVLINCDGGVMGRPTIRVDNAAAAAAMTNHLLAIGRRGVVHLAGPSENVEARERAAGYAAAMIRAGLEPRTLQGDFSEQAGVEAANVILSDPHGVDALFAANDMMAIGALTMLRRAGIDVPGRVAVAGFDDIPLARLVTPPLTTMRVDMAEIGARAVARLAAAIEGADDATSEIRRPQLVVRSTTGAVAFAVADQDTTRRGGLDRGA